jgi:RNA 2',3'-cyclic 3'-phosphodiesterase
MVSASRHISMNIRTFIGVRVIPDTETLRLIDSIRNELAGEKIRWTHPRNFHITVLFIGDTSPEALVKVKRSMDEITRQIESFSFLISGFGVFRSINHPRVLWLGVRENDGLAKLKSITDRVLLPLLRLEESEKYSPHLTLGRMKSINDSAKLAEVMNRYGNSVKLKVMAEELTFFESLTAPGGAEYRPISSHPLK